MKTWTRTLAAALLAATLPIMVAAQTAAGDFKDRTIRVSHVVPKDHPFQVGVDRFAELVAQKTGGNTVVGRTLTGSSTGVVITNGDGVAGNPVIA
ncbi:MAG: hypothetical protein EBS99_13470, partial [Betaproteobacteria bacterium]|nr:hypothetical protein [Betaproteobacteria bacterium]